MFFFTTDAQKTLYIVISSHLWQIEQRPLELDIARGQVLDGVQVDDAHGADELVLAEAAALVLADEQRLVLQIVEGQLKVKGLLVDGRERLALHLGLILALLVGQELNTHVRVRLA